MLFSILIPVRDDLKNLLICLRALARQDLADAEILICDDGSRSPIAPMDLAATGIRLQLFRLDGRGPAAARNYLARKASGKYLFFLDADTEPRPDTVDCVREVISEHPTIGAFFGSYDNAPLHPSLISVYKNLLHHYTHQQSGGRQVSAFWCGCGVILRDLYLHYGGLSETYRRPSIEDTELGMRMSMHGMRVLVVPELQVKHLKLWTLKSWLYTDLFCRGIPWVRMMRSNRKWADLLNFSWANRIAALAALGFVSLACAAIFRPWVMALAPLPLALFIYLHYGFFHLVAERRGLLVAAAVIPLHLVYSLVCVLSLIMGIFYPGMTLEPTTE